MKIAVLVSGGVDSSLALRLLKEEGHDLTAFYLKIWLQDEFSFLGECPWEEDLKFVRAVCKNIDVHIEVIPLQTEYWDNVVTYTIDEIKEGRTPNPDIFCNSLIKFGQFFDKIDDSFEKVASGHYANIIEKDTKFLLTTSPDPIKDQTYFLSYLNQHQLGRSLFPIGNLLKKDVRSLATTYKLPTSARKDSQGICFLGQIKFKEFIRHHLGENPGKIVDIDSDKVMGEHEGYYYFTIGQRSGLKLGGGPWYVVRKDIDENVVYISKENKAIRERNNFSVGKINWISDGPPQKTNLKVKIRHGANYYNCDLRLQTEVSGEVKIGLPDKGIAPGQFAVFYDENICLGGGVILQD